MIQTYALEPRKPSTPDASPVHSHTTLVHSTAYRAAATRVRPARSRTAKEGSSHTRWCTHVTGLTRQAVSPVSANAAVQSPRDAARPVRRAHTHSTTAAAAAHSPRPGSPSRARTPWSDWLETYSARPTRPVSHSASVQ